MGVRIGLDEIEITDVGQTTLTVALLTDVARGLVSNRWSPVDLQHWATVVLTLVDLTTSPREAPFAEATTDAVWAGWQASPVAPEAPWCAEDLVTR